ncbi:sensor histidine kinase [Marinicella marina]|uniref:sensor histidine kinase n=1 Tax=Marinicella marina TaxID=2996016 RepID=UPI0024BCE0BA|nr:ATP-binding protein [Marinicella marina]MDJ1139814.1 ATP-binding protein [Marinicella marina]
MKAKTMILNKNIPLLFLVVALLSALYLLGTAVQSAEQFNRIYIWLFAASVLAVVILTLIIIQRIVWLVLKRKKKEPGIQLTTRMVLMFTGLSLPPVIILYLFATMLVNQYVDSWFDVATDAALNDAISLGNIFLETQTVTHLNTGKDIASELAEYDPLNQGIYLDRLLENSKASSLGIYDTDGQLITSASIDPLKFIAPNLPQNTIREVSNGRNYARVEPTGSERMQVRVVVPISSNRSINLGQSRILQGLFSIPEEYRNLAINIETQFHEYDKQNFQRQQLKSTFMIILTVVLLISVLLAMLRAFSSARRLVEPIKMLSEATDAITQGNFSKVIPVETDDELGLLVKSFNSMSTQIATSSALAHRAQSEAENQRAYLESVMSHLTSGVISIDNDFLIRLSNESTHKILHLGKRSLINQNIDYLAMKNPTLLPLIDIIKQKVAEKTNFWQQEVLIAEDSLRRVLLVRGSQITDSEMEGGGHVIVFDDQTIINQAQRDAAWSEVARRLAHEVKNPLTPIQLSAERIHMRLSGKLGKEEDEILNRATQTIVAQVENLKTLVNAFSDYAKPPELKKELGGLNRLINETVDLFSLSHPSIQFTTELTDPEPRLLLDRGRMTQLLTNLIKNTQESANQRHVKINISTEVLANHLVLSIKDNGSGFSPDIIEHVFEPYETTKQGGSGLGLAIVKKIVEEHGGTIEVRNHHEGAIIEIKLPLA